MRLIDAVTTAEVIENKFNIPLVDLVDVFAEIPTVDIKTEVAREIFAEIDKLIYRYLNDVDYSGGDLIYDLGELKNKYIGGVGE